MKKQSKYGGAPKRSQRSRLRDKGYDEYRIDGNSVFTEKSAKSYVEYLHKKGYLAQALHIRDYNIPSSWWVVMYKKKG